MTVNIFRVKKVDWFPMGFSFVETANTLLFSFLKEKNKIPTLIYTGLSEHKCC
jgi:hypothetical protein